MQASNRPEKPKRKIPNRQCLGCGESKPKKELIRVVRPPDGEVSLDFTGKKSGRGAYICPTVSCFKRVRKSKRLEKNLECVIPESVYDELESRLINNEDGKKQPW